MKYSLLTFLVKLSNNSMLKLKKQRTNQRANVKNWSWKCEKDDDEDSIDKDTWDEKDKFLMKAISDYLPLAINDTIKEMKNFDLLHYVFVVPSEWEEKRKNAILCRISPEEKKIIIKFGLIQTMSPRFNFPNSRLFPKVTNSNTLSITVNDVENRIKAFLRTNLFPETTDADCGRKPLKRFLKTKLLPFDQDQIIQSIMDYIFRRRMPPLDKKNGVGLGVSEAIQNSDLHCSYRFLRNTC
ncbi:hypothetical protein BDF21DRAFT_397168 [Thamnidium elegans]|nr:hypothetical protein BDF21DRAFT_397168 [Thamnidium elegans]